MLSFLIVQQPDEQLEDAEQEAGHRLEGEVMYMFLYKHGSISTPADDFKRRYVDIDARVQMYVSQSALLVKEDDSLWHLHDESI